MATNLFQLTFSQIRYEKNFFSQIRYENGLPLNFLCISIRNTLNFTNLSTLVFVLKSESLSLRVLLRIVQHWSLTYYVALKLSLQLEKRPWS